MTDKPDSTKWFLIGVVVVIIIFTATLKFMADSLEPEARTNSSLVR